MIKRKEATWSEVMGAKDEAARESEWNIVLEGGELGECNKDGNLRIQKKWSLAQGEVEV